MEARLVRKLETEVLPQRAEPWLQGFLVRDGKSGSTRQLPMFLKEHQHLPSRPRMVRCSNVILFLFVDKKDIREEKPQ